MNKWTPSRNSGGIPQVSTIFSLSMEMSRLTRDGTAESVSRDQILRHERRQRNFHFPVELTTCRSGNLTRLIHTLYSSVYYRSTGCQPARGQLNRENKYIFLSRSRLRIWSRKTASAVLSRVSLIILHTQAESHACCTRNRVSPELIGSRNCVPIASTVESPPAPSQCRSQGSSSSGCYL